jgi:hypothetical protein
MAIGTPWNGHSSEGSTAFTPGCVLRIETETFSLWPTAIVVELTDSVSSRPEVDVAEAVEFGIGCTPGSVDDVSEDVEEEEDALSELDGVTGREPSNMKPTVPTKMIMTMARTMTVVPMALRGPASLPRLRRRSVIDLIREFSFKVRLGLFLPWAGYSSMV